MISARVAPFARFIILMTSAFLWVGSSAGSLGARPRGALASYSIRVFLSSTFEIGLTVKNARKAEFYSPFTAIRPKRSLAQKTY
jgi:hypothetical protein